MSKAPVRSRKKRLKAPVKSLIMLINPASGSVGPRAAEEAAEILKGYAVEATIVSLLPATFGDQINAAFSAQPDALIVLAGDGTAGTIASRAGKDGPLVAPLPGGTMNMLPRAIYGTADWKAALKLVLERGVAQPVAGGEVFDDRTKQPFFCAAILGAPALWAPAREAVRSGRFSKAFHLARHALNRAFSGRIRFSLNNAQEQRSEALVLISPVISAAMETSDGLEAAAMNPADAIEAFRLAANAVLNDWRQDPSVTTRTVRYANVRAHARIPAVIDGEPIMLARRAKVRFVKEAFRAWAPSAEAI